MMVMFCKHWMRIFFLVATSVGTICPALAQESSPTSQPLTAQANKPETGTEAKPVTIPEVKVKEMREEGYRVKEATTATKTDTPLRDIPQSVQVVPRAVMEDQRTLRLQEALRNVSGVSVPLSFGGRTEGILIRGFFNGGTVFKNGFRDDGASGTRTARDLQNIKRIEVVKGPASALYGRLDPGGSIHLITKQPLAEPSYAADLTVGSFNLYRPSLDLTGPLNAAKTLRYRFNAAYEVADSFRDRVETERTFVSPVLSWAPAPGTLLTLEGEYLHDNRPIDRGLVAVNRGVANIPISRVLGDPELRHDFDQKKVSLVLNHTFSNAWSLRSAYRYSTAFEAGSGAGIQGLTLLADNRTLTMAAFTGSQNYESHTLLNDLTWRVRTGPIAHTALLGLELNRDYSTATGNRAPVPSINIFQPVPRKFAVGVFAPSFRGSTDREVLGLYLQDQVTLLENLKLALGGRFDYFDEESLNALNGVTTRQQNTAITPRIGLVYQPIQPVSLYANYSKSFVPQIGRAAAGTPFEPERGEQYEVGVKPEFFGERLSATLALFQITKENILTTDPANPLFSLAVGKQRSRGIEVDVRGQVLPGWNVIVTYAFTDAEITKDNRFRVGNELQNVAEHAGSLWTTYAIQTGVLRGLGFGVGIFAQGERAGDLANSFDLPEFVRTDAALYYDFKPFLVQVNVQNLFDVTYFQGSGGGRVQAIPGAPLTVLGSLGIRF